MGREQYLWEGYRQINNSSHYSKLIRPIETDPLVENIIKTMHDKKFINAKQKAYPLPNSEPSPRLFYLFPKIHNDPEKWSKPNEIPPGRPIVSDCGSETYQTAQVLDFYLNPLSSTHSSYIKDTYDFVNKINKIQIPEKFNFIHHGHRKLAHHY